MSANNKRAVTTTKCNFWTPAENALLRELRFNGVPVSKMARLLPKHPESSIKSHLFKLGLTGDSISRKVVSIKSVTKPVKSVTKSLAKPVSDQSEMAKMRPCLGPLCKGKMFWSMGIGHRMCKRCRAHAALFSSSIDSEGAGVG